MKFSSFSLASALLAASAVAKPLERRDDAVVTNVVWVTETQTVTALIDATTTIYMVSGQVLPTPVSADTSKTTAEQSEKTPAPSQPQAKPHLEPKPSPQPAPEPSPEPVPQPAPQPAPEPAPQPAPQPAPEPAPQPAPEPAPQPAPKPAPQPEPEAHADSAAAGSANHRSGDLTYYAVGLGACGEDDSGKDQSDYIFALSHLLMGAQSNGNSFCGKKVKACLESDKSKCVTGTVRDKCMGCQMNDLDSSEKVYKKLLGSLDSGRQPISWTFV